MVFELMSKDYQGEVAKFSELVRLPAKQLKMAEQQKEAHESRKDLMNINLRSEIRRIQPERFGENHVTNNGIWRVSKLFGSCESAQSSMHRSQDRNTSRINVGPAWSKTTLHKMLIGYRITFVRLSSAIRRHLDEGAC